MSDDPKQPQQPTEADIRAVTMVTILVMNAVMLQNLILASHANDKKAWVRHLGEFAVALEKEYKDRDLLAEVKAFAASLNININLYMTPFETGGRPN